MPTDSVSDSIVRTEDQHRRDICLVGRWMYERGHIVACEGNLSIRLDADRILTTPTCINKGMMSPEDLVVMDMEGRHLRGDRKISSEAGMHLLFYRMRPMSRLSVMPILRPLPGFAAAGLGFDQAAAPGNCGWTRQSAAGSLRHSRHARSKRSA